MTNVWDVLLQTLTVTAVAVMLLAVKRLLRDQLSPRWQYGVWAVLGLRALLPASVERYVLLPTLWLEVGKAEAEQGLESAFTQIYEPIGGSYVLPMIGGQPRSLTDWLFVVYAVGVALFGLRYLMSYMRLRGLLNHGTSVSFSTEEKLKRVRDRYGLPKCRAVAVAGLTGPFVCGVFRPVLAVPEGEDVDEKVLLHELLHLRHYDALQSIFWCGVRCLHWCNPVMHYVVDRIGNDMEALCDQRVLEMLEGEERRDYGVILLSMANDRYARAPGTTSISNGGANIARRIEAIVRFKKYPKGMGLVSVCIAFVLLVPCMTGQATAIDVAEYTPGSVSDLPRAMAMARIERCDTVAGALDTYAKGLLYENGIYIAMTSPLSEHEALEARMRQSGAEGWYACRLPAGEKLEYMDTNGEWDHFKYGIYELTDNGDGTYCAWMAIGVYGYADESGNLVQETNENGDVMARYRRVLFPVEVYYSDGWCVRETGERVYEYTPVTDVENHGRLLPKHTYQVEGASGTLTITERLQYIVDESMAGWHPFGVSGLNGAVDPDAEFVSVEVDTTYTFFMKEAGSGISAMVGGVLPTERSKHSLPGAFLTTSWAAGSSGDGTVWVREPTVVDGQNPGLEMSNTYDCLESSGTNGLYGYQVQIYRDDVLVEEFTVTKEDLV